MRMQDFHSFSPSLSPSRSLLSKLITVVGSICRRGRFVSVHGMAFEKTPLPAFSPGYVHAFLLLRVSQKEAVAHSRRPVAPTALPDERFRCLSPAQTGMLRVGPCPTERRGVPALPAAPGRGQGATRTPARCFWSPPCGGLLPIPVHRFMDQDACRVLLWSRISAKWSPRREFLSQPELVRSPASCVFCEPLLRCRPGQ